MSVFIIWLRKIGLSENSVRTLFKSTLLLFNVGIFLLAKSESFNSFRSKIGASTIEKTELTPSIPSSLFFNTLIRLI